MKHHTLREKTLLNTILSIDRECHALEFLNVHSDIVESTEKKTLDGFATFEPRAAWLLNFITLRTLLDTGSQLACDRFITGSLTGRRSLIYYEPSIGPFLGPKQTCTDTNWEQTCLWPDTQQGFQCSIKALVGNYHRPVTLQVYGTTKVTAITFVVEKCKHKHMANLSCSISTMWFCLPW